MKKLDDKTLTEINGGTTITDLTLTATLLNAIVKVGELVLQLGESFGSSVRRISGDNICNAK